MKLNERTRSEWKGAIMAIFVVAMVCIGIGFAVAAWDDTKSTSDSLTAAEWNAQIIDQKNRTSPFTLVVAASDSLDTSKADYICDGTADQTEINNAITALPACGGTVSLLEGTYTISGQINMVSDSVLAGNGWQNTRLLMAHGGDAIELAGYDNITIRDIEIDGNNRAYVSGSMNEIIDGTGNDDVTIERIYMHDHGSAYGIELWNAKRLRILDSRFTKIGCSADSDPISIQESTDVTIAGNVIYDSVYEYRAGAIEVQDGCGKIIITNNHIYKSQVGMSLSVHNAGEHNTEYIVTDNIIEVYNVDLETNPSTTYPLGIYVSGISGTSATQHLISGNIISVNVDAGSHDAVLNAGIVARNTNNAIISNNIINNTAKNQEAGNYGILVDGVSNATICGNILTDCYYSGIFARRVHGEHDNENIILTNNRCSGSEKGIDITVGDYLILCHNNCRGNSIDGINVTAGQNTNGIEANNLE